MLKATDPSSYMPASRRRILLAGYLDFLILSVALVLAARALTIVFPGIGALSFPVKIVLFLIIEVVLLRYVQWSPGSGLLAITVFKPNDLEAASQESLGGRVLLVDSAIYRSERWWTLLLGVFCVLDGSKSLARWTQYVMPTGFFGKPIDDEAAIAFQIFTGAALWIFAVGAFRLRPALLAAGAIFTSLSALSWVYSWSLLPDIITEYVVRRRAFQGMPVRAGEIEGAQAFLPKTMLIFSVVTVIWFVLALIHSIRLRNQRS